MARASLGPRCRTCVDQLALQRNAFYANFPRSRQCFEMTRLRRRVALYALSYVASVPLAHAASACPAANMASLAYCFCTTGCSIDGDNVLFPWSAPVFPPQSVQLGADTVCATIALPCSNQTQYASLLAYIGVSGDVQRDGPGNDFAGCTPGTVVITATAFTSAECATFASLYNALPNVVNLQGVPTAHACATDNCNLLGHLIGAPPPPPPSPPMPPPPAACPVAAPAADGKLIIVVVVFCVVGVSFAVGLALCWRIKSRQAPVRGEQSRTSGGYTRGQMLTQMAAAEYAGGDAETSAWPQQPQPPLPPPPPPHRPYVYQPAPRNASQTFNFGYDVDDSFN